MSKRYRVTHSPHYIGARLVYPDQGANSIVELPEGVKPGRWLVAVDDAPAVALTPASAPAGRYIAKHVGGGHYHVEGVDDGERASVVFKRDDGDAKAKAEAEAARLNAGGELQLETEDAPPPWPDDAPAGTGDDDLPDA